MKAADELQKIFEGNDSVVRRDFDCGKEKATLFFHSDLTDSETLREFIRAAGEGAASMEKLCLETVFVSECKITDDVSEAADGVLCGDGVFVFEKENRYLVFDAKKYDKRAVSEPPTETVVRGPREGFTEDIKTNLALLSRRFKTPALKVKKLSIGRQSKTCVAVVWLQTVADNDIVNRIVDKLKNIDIDVVVDSNYLVSFLEERPHSLFKQVGYTEKPDIASAKISEGRVAIISDGSPMVLTLPFLLAEDFQSGDDYYERSGFASVVRIVRVFALLLSVLLPGVYVAFQVYHYEMLPNKFLITLMNAVKGVPLPPMWEMLFVILLFEIIRDASIRMPRATGMAMSIVGAIVLGDTAVKAGLVSSPAVMLTALSSLALFTAPNEVGTMSIMRLAITVAGGIAGALGIVLVSIYTIHYLCKTDSYGSPYLAPFAPIIFSDRQDSVTISPRREMTRRPESIRNVNPTRERSS